MFYFLALNSGPAISGNDISVYPVTGIGFVLRDFSKVFSHTFRLDMAELTLWRAVIKWYYIYICIYPMCHAYSCKHKLELNAKHKTYTGNRII